MSIEKRNDGYSVRWRDASGRSRSQQVTLWRDAIKLDGDKKRLRAMGALALDDRGTVAFVDLYERWIKDYVAVHVTPRTRGSYEDLWRIYVPGRLKHKQVRLLERADFDTLVRELSKKYAPSTIRKIMAILQSILQRGVEWQYVAINPLVGVKRPRVAGSQRVGRVLTQQDIFDLCVAGYDRSTRDGMILRVLESTGMRPGELRGLRWADIAQDRILVERAVSDDKIGPTKTRATRWVPLDGLTYFELVRYAKVQHASSPALVQPTALVFPGRDGIWTDNGYRAWVKQVFKPITTAAGLDGIRPYDLRHSYISRRIHAGADVVTLSREVGNSPDVLLSTYAHEFESVRLECADGLLIDEILMPAGGLEPPTPSLQANEPKDSEP